MKKNLLTIIILAFQVVQVAMLGLLLFSVMSTNSKTAKIVADIADAIELEKAGGTGGGASPEGTVALADQETYVIAGEDKLMVPLRIGADGNQHYLQAEVQLLVNKTHEDYEKYGTAAQLDAFKSRIKTVTMDTLQNYTIEQAQDIALRGEIANAVLAALQNLYEGSQFIYKVEFPSFIPS